MKTLKDAAPAEIEALRKRTHRSLAMKRVYPADAASIINRLDEVEAIIVNMSDPQEDRDA